MRALHVAVGFMIALSSPGTSSAEAMAPLKVSDNGRFLVHTDGRPFFYLGDTAWELFHRLNREEAELYLANRAEKGFTVIQAVVVAELNGIKQGNAYDQTPFMDRDPSRPNEAYFEHVDWIVNKAASLGLYTAMLPAWGRWVGENDHDRPDNNFFNEANARTYGKFLGERYKGQPIIWVLGGDRPATTSAPVWNEMAAGLREAVGRSQLISYHPRSASSADFHSAKWLDFNMVQSGHSAESTNYTMIEHDYALEPVKPCMDSEPAYEYPPDAMPEHRPVGALQVRRNAYWAIFAGAHGHTYGTHPIWQMYDEGRKPLWDVQTPWHKSLDLPGASQLIHLKNLILSKPYLTRIPDQSVIAGEVPGGVDRVQVTRDGGIDVNDATFILAYFPSHQRVSLHTSRIGSQALQVSWYNPRTGETVGQASVPNPETAEFEPPTNVPGEDWVLVLESSPGG